MIKVCFISSLDRIKTEHDWTREWGKGIVKTIISLFRKKNPGPFNIIQYIIRDKHPFITNIK